MPRRVNSSLTYRLVALWSTKPLDFALRRSARSFRSPNSILRDRYHRVTSATRSLRSRPLRWRTALRCERSSKRLHRPRMRPCCVRSVWSLLREPASSSGPADVGRLRRFWADARRFDVQPRRAADVPSSVVRLCWHPAGAPLTPVVGRRMEAPRDTRHCVWHGTTSPWL